MAAQDVWRGDAGLARERSDLSWGRTLLALITVTALFTRWLPQFGPAAVVPVLIGVLAGVGLMRLRHGRRAEVYAGRGSAVEAVVGLSALVVLVGMSALAFIVVDVLST